MAHSAHPLGPVEYALLGLLRLSPRHGYELAAEFQPAAELGDALRVDLSDLYAVLKRLERRGFVIGHTEQAGGRPPRRVYQLTASGEAEVRRWLIEPVRHNRDIRLDFIVKLYFVPKLAPDLREDLLARQLAAALDQLNRLRTDVQRYPAGSFGWALRQMRIHAVRATIVWLEELRATIPEA